MKSKTVLSFVVSFIIFAAVTAASAFLLAFITYKSGAYGTAGAMAGVAVLCGSFCGALYIKKNSSFSTALPLNTGIFLSSLIIMALLTRRSPESVPFLVPVCCAVGGMLPCFMQEKASASHNVRKMLKKR